MRAILIGTTSAIMLGAAVAPANADCTCRARGGIEAVVGQTICLATPNGLQLARCDQVLNNPSWTFLESGCPQAMLDELLNTQTARALEKQSHPVVR